MFPLNADEAKSEESTAYFSSRSSSTVHLLRAQLTFVERFERFQQDTRERFDKEGFDRYVAESQALRQEYGLKTDIVWSYRVAEQCWEKRWSEYQYWCILKIEEKKQRLSMLDKEMENLRHRHRAVEDDFSNLSRLLDWTKTKQKSQVSSSWRVLRKPSRIMRRSLRATEPPPCQKPRTSRSRKTNTAKPSESIGITKTRDRRDIQSPARFV